MGGVSAFTGRGAAPGGAGRIGGEPIDMDAPDADGSGGVAMDSVAGAPVGRVGIGGIGGRVEKSGPAGRAADGRGIDGGMPEGEKPGAGRGDVAEVGLCAVGETGRTVVVVGDAP